MYHSYLVGIANSALLAGRTAPHIIPSHFTAGEKKNLASIPFFISLLTLLSGMILIDGVLAESKAVARKLGFRGLQVSLKSISF